MQKARSLRFALCALRVRVVSELEIGKCPTVDCALESCLYQHQPALLALALAPYKSKFPVKPKPQTQPAIGVLSFLLLVVGVRRPWLPLPRSQKGSKPKTQDARCCWAGYAPRLSCHLPSSIHLRAAARAERWAILPCAPLHIPALLGFGSWFFVLLSDLPHSSHFPSPFSWLVPSPSSLLTFLPSFPSCLLLLPPPLLLRARHHSSTLLLLWPVAVDILRVSLFPCWRAVISRRPLRRVGFRGLRATTAMQAFGCASSVCGRGGATARAAARGRGRRIDA